MDRYINKLLVGVEQKAQKNENIVELSEWFHNIAFDVPCLLSLLIIGWWNVDFGCGIQQS